MASVWESIPVGLIVTVALGLIPTAFLIYVGWWKQRYNIDVDLYSESSNGVPFVRKVGARLLEDQGVKKIQFGSLTQWNMRQRPSPTLDALVPQTNGRLKISYWRDTHGQLHQMRFTKRVPLESKLSDAGEWVLEDEEIVFTPEKESYKEFSKMELKRLWSRHKDKHWMERYGGVITVMVVGGFACLTILLIVWFLGGKIDTLVSALVNTANEISLNKAVTP